MASSMTRLQALLTSATILIVVAARPARTRHRRSRRSRTKDPSRPSVPVEEPARTPFDRSAAASVLSSVDLSKCKSTNAPRGEGHIIVKFSPDGTRGGGVVDKGPVARERPVAKCIANEFKKAKVPAFTGDSSRSGSRSASSEHGLG